MGSIVKPGNMLYGSTKAALEYLTRAWAYELAEDRIRVNCIAPGPVDTPIHATYSADLAATYADLARRVPLQRMGEVDDVATWVCWLVAPETAWTTGMSSTSTGDRCLVYRRRVEARLEAVRIPVPQRCLYPAGATWDRKPAGTALGFTRSGFWPAAPNRTEVNGWPRQSRTERGSCLWLSSTSCSTRSRTGDGGARTTPEGR